MKVLVKTLLTAASIAVLSCSVQAQEVKSLEQLLEQVKSNRVSEARQNTAREKEFQAARADKQALLNRAQRELKATEFLKLVKIPLVKKNSKQLVLTSKPC